jgi:hypothetical protein
MKNQNNYNRQPANYNQQPPNYPQQGSSYQPGPNQMSNYQPGPNQMSNYQPGPNQMSQPMGGQPPYYQQQSQYGPQTPNSNQMSPAPYRQGPYNQYDPAGQYSQQPFPPQGSQYNNQTDIPNFTLTGRGTGIDEQEFYVITHSAADALFAKEDPLSNGIIKRIKNQIGGEWMVFASVEGLKGYDFSLSIVTGNDFLSFTIEKFRFQVCRLRD